jgi:hypothetical protein
VATHQCAQRRRVVSGACRGLRSVCSTGPAIVDIGTLRCGVAVGISSVTEPKRQRHSSRHSHVGSSLVVRPFLTAFLWGAIIAVSSRALYQRFVRLVRGREKVAAVLFGLFLAAILFVPISFFAVRLAA